MLALHRSLDVQGPESVANKIWGPRSLDRTQFRTLRCKCVFCDSVIAPHETPPSLAVQRDELKHDSGCHTIHRRRVKRISNLCGSNEIPSGSHAGLDPHNTQAIGFGGEEDEVGLEPFELIIPSPTIHPPTTYFSFWYNRMGFKGGRDYVPETYRCGFLYALRRFGNQSFLGLAYVSQRGP